MSNKQDDSVVIPFPKRANKSKVLGTDESLDGYVPSCSVIGCKINYYMGGYCKEHHDELVKIIQGFNSSTLIIYSVK